MDLSRNDASTASTLSCFNVVSKQKRYSHSFQTVNCGELSCRRLNFTELNESLRLVDELLFAYQKRLSKAKHETDWKVRVSVSRINSIKEQFIIMQCFYFRLTAVATSDDDGSCQMAYVADNVAAAKHREGVGSDGALIGYLGSRRSVETAHRRQSPMTISDAAAAATECGTERTPWLVTVRPGQRIRITVMDFTAPALSESDEELDEEYPRSTKRRGQET
jgi:hypothetical protein